ncbi:MAG: FlgD immunoglobulin-like domain containing protein [Candidatus Gracilibacteria bacterium]|jgi:hypothetical protein
MKMNKKSLVIAMIATASVLIGGVFFAFKAGAFEGNFYIYKLKPTQLQHTIKDPIGGITLAPVISQIVIFPSTINPQKNETAQISFYLDKTATTTLAIYNSNGLMVKKIFVNSYIGVGTHVYYLNGKDSFGNNLPAGAYNVTIMAINQYGETLKTSTLNVVYTQ